ncbi:hypothetical protein FA15DRAFT_734316 [Coprinopsis marcescibilis]|uniref:Helicase C-terminal domain-containing protein n=1 Tax=Coprinopsis marcescibilis TaxID=230819 RepID=A0A5C3KC63_COPMA|nr:hypothetical protein FA15DRAFT_734316 [Coprinopsis marcescibilis]
MPSHTNPSGLVKLYFADGAFPQAPWCFDGWQEITGIRHGLFDPDDKRLPPGWTRADSVAVYAYFDLYNKQIKEEDKQKVAIVPRGVKHDPIPGRTFFRDWVNGRWAKMWKIHIKISKALTDAGLHPVQIVLDNGGDLEMVPNASLYLPGALDDIGRELYGEDCLNKAGHLHNPLRDATLIFAQRTWQIAARSIGPKKKRLLKLQQDAEEALKALQVAGDGEITLGGINAAIRAVAAYQRANEALPTSHGSEISENLKSDLQPFIPADDSPESAPTKGSKNGELISKHTLTTHSPIACALAKSRGVKMTLATEHEVAQIVDMYDVYLGEDTASTEPLSMSSISEDASNPSDSDFCGVELESNLDSDTLASRLGFREGRPFLFNEKRHTGELTPWDDNFDNLLASEPSKFIDFKPHWHQYCGAHAIARNAFSDVADGCATSSLLADGVGVGKTVQAAAVMAFFTDLAMRTVRGLPMPAIVCERPFLKGSNKVPNHAHLIVVPGTLIRQTEHELRSFFKPKSVDILIYPSGVKAHAEFFKPGGVWNSSNHDPSFRIIIASQSALKQDYSALYTSVRSPKGLPWDPCSRASGYDTRVNSTLYGLEFLTVTWDEAQGLRNTGTMHLSALLILEQAMVRMILTATPIQTSIKDVAAMGRIMGIPYFLSEQAHRDQLGDLATIRRAKLERGDDLEDDDDPVKEVQAEICLRLHDKFEGRIIRRTSSTLSPDNKPLINLPPLHIVRGALQLTEREYKQLDKLTIADLKDASTANSRAVCSSKFYIAHRMGVTFTRENPSDPIPLFTSLSDWEAQKSTKIDCLVRMVQHILLRDDMPPIEFDECGPVFRPAPTNPNCTRNVKILIYQEFPSFIGLVRSVFALYGIPVLTITGKNGYDARAASINKFNSDPESRVLIFSKVGATGLNLTRASVIIFLDQPWSAQDEAQIRGRPHRQGQTLDVWAYHLLATDTADPILAALAAGKKDMLDTFVKSKASRGASVFHRHYCLGADSFH